MLDNYTSEKLLRELPRPLLNFLWYLWETYDGLCSPEFRITLQSAENVNAQSFYIQSTGKTITQDFGCCINADIVIRKEGTKYFMEYY